MSFNENKLFAPKFFNGWELYKLYDLATWKNGLAFKKQHFSEIGKPIIKIAELKNGITAQTKFTQQEFDEVYYLKKNDMLFSWSGSPDTSIDVFKFELEEGWLNQHIFRVNNNNLITKEYLYYILKYLKPNFIQIAKNKQTTGLGHITITDLKNIDVRIPNIDEQYAISNILSKLDSKIEVNNKINKNLEDMAQAIFKHWFVDFEFPNEEGKSYKSSGGKMVESELGMIPNGWEVKRIEDVCNKINSGGTPSRKKEDYYGGNIPWLKTKELVDNFIYYSEEYITDKGLAESSAKIFPPDTVLIAIYASPTVGRLGIATDYVAFNQAMCGIVADEKVLGYEYLYLYLLNERDNLNNLATGSAQQNLSVSIIKNYPIVIPNNDLMKKFKKYISNIFLIIKNNTLENSRLSNLRDTLLPKLMSGEIRVPID